MDILDTPLIVKEIVDGEERKGAHWIQVKSASLVVKKSMNLKYFVVDHFRTSRITAWIRPVAVSS
jgi:hypothetical protein